MGARQGGGRRLGVIVKKSSELRDCKHTSRALVRAGHDKSGVVRGAAAAAAHERSKNARVEEANRVQVDADAIGATLESGVDALSHLRGGGDVVFARQPDGHPPAVSLQISHCATTCPDGPRHRADPMGSTGAQISRRRCGSLGGICARALGSASPRGTDVSASPSSDSMSVGPVPARRLPKAAA